MTPCVTLSKAVYGLLWIKYVINMPDTAGLCEPWQDRGREYGTAAGQSGGDRVFLSVKCWDIITGADSLTNATK